MFADVRVPLIAEVGVGATVVGGGPVGPAYKKYNQLIRY